MAALLLNAAPFAPILLVVAIISVGLAVQHVRDVWRASQGVR